MVVVVGGTSASLDCRTLPRHSYLSAGQTVGATGFDGHGRDGFVLEHIWVKNPRLPQVTTRSTPGRS